MHLNDVRISDLSEAFSAYPDAFIRGVSYGDQDVIVDLGVPDPPQAPLGGGTTLDEDKLWKYVKAATEIGASVSPEHQAAYDVLAARFADHREIREARESVIGGAVKPIRAKLHGYRSAHRKQRMKKRMAQLKTDP